MAYDENGNYFTDEADLEHFNRAVPRHNSIEDHNKRLEQEKMLELQREFIKANVLYILGKYVGPMHTSTVAIEEFFKTKP